MNQNEATKKELNDSESDSVDTSMWNRQASTYNINSSRPSTNPSLSRRPSAHPKKWPVKKQYEPLKKQVSAFIARAKYNIDSRLL